MTTTPAGVLIDLITVSASSRLEHRSPASKPDGWALLDADEQRRAARLRHPARKALFIAAHTRLRQELGMRLNCPAAEVPLARMPCPRCADPDHGRPVFAVSSSSPEVHTAILTEKPVKAPVRFSVSYTDDLALIAISSRPVGVDVECTFDRPTTDRLREMLLTDALPRPLGHEISEALQNSAVSHRTAAATSSDGAENELTRTWVRAEARLKALGCGLCDSPLGSEEHLLNQTYMPADTSTIGQVLVITDVPLLHVGLLPDGSTRQKVKTRNRQLIAHLALAM
ncbi:4'-phosphopantetheinyl transferase family protein [Pseudoclavibacter sp. 13-3]|uniref:4'-phosphopantetheinyl transferase family protein n=1 Tax=Pseudoclavibacter sp. 13-3 TaxID=2901228 RepID=UPI001E442347|nr:hypothetical protein [Pseudoclavibacter sp. 13-3]MCD7101041.1 hypothetical protein [Pseudoclavibacter sp. 13-3]